MIKVEDEYWINYYDDEFMYLNLDENKVGKWMYFFRDEAGYKFAEAICEEAIESGIIFRAKHNPKTRIDKGGVICFYLNCDDIERHKLVISFLIKNNMIQKTKNGKFYNISFKLNSQTLEDKYGENYDPTIKLSDFIDLTTGEWIK